LSYSVLAAETAALEVKVDLETATCDWDKDCNSGGTEPEALANRDPPSSGFLPDDRDLSNSMRITR
jgi:hypothetical protein